MNLISIRDFIKYKKPDNIHIVNEYVMFTDWKLTLGMFAAVLLSPFILFYWWLTED